VQPVISVWQGCRSLSLEAVFAPARLPYPNCNSAHRDAASAARLITRGPILRSVHPGPSEQAVQESSRNRTGRHHDVTSSGRAPTSATTNGLMPQRVEVQDRVRGRVEPRAIPVQLVSERARLIAKAMKRSLIFANSVSDRLSRSSRSRNSRAKPSKKYRARSLMRALDLTMAQRGPQASGGRY
jgi:hypothetical protein